MKKYVFLIISILLFCSTSYAQKKSNIFTSIAAERQYNKYANKAIEKHKWINFELVTSGIKNGNPLPVDKYQVSYYNDKDSAIVYFSYPWNIFLKIYSNKLYSVNDDNQELSIFKRHGENDCYEFTRANAEDRFMFFPYFERNTIGKLFGSQDFSLIYHKDTIVNKKQKIKFYGVGLKSHTYNKNTKKYDIPSQYMAITWIDKNSNMVDSIVIHQLQKEQPAEKRKYTICNLNYKDQSSKYSLIFDFKNPKYNNYSRHNNTNIPYSERNSSNITMTKELLTFPITNFDGKTTSISKMSGWLLLDFWSKGCKPCYEQFMAIQHEKDSLGQSILDSYNVRLVSVNPCSNNAEELVKITDKYQATNYSYYAKGIGEFIKINSYPTYYLISPDKKIILCPKHLGNYSEIVKAIDDYNRKNSSIQINKK